MSIFDLPAVREAKTPRGSDLLASAEDGYVVLERYHNGLYYQAQADISEALRNMSKRDLESIAWELESTLDDLIAEHEAELEARILVKACPWCGLEVIHSCYHDGQEIYSKSMKKGRAQQLREDYIDELISEIELRGGTVSLTTETSASRAAAGGDSE